MLLAKISSSETKEDDANENYTSALHLANVLNPFLVHEVLCQKIGKPHILPDEDMLQLDIINICDDITSKQGDTLKTRSGLGISNNRSKLLAEIANIRVHVKESIQHPSNATRHALIIGIAAYQKMSRLNKTLLDAKDLHDLLLESGFHRKNIDLLLDGKATKGRIDAALNKLASSTTSEDTTIIFFSGHGAHFPGGLNPGEYLCTVESDPDNLQSTAISSSELSKAIKSIPAKQVVVLLDACHSGGVGDLKGEHSTIKSGLSENAYNELAGGEGRVVIASCKPSEVSWELVDMRNGLFSNFLLKGMHNEAVDHEGAVRIFTLFDYISQEVPKYRPQTPMIKLTADRNFPIIKWATPRASRTS
jgi:hypothetical protein